MEIVVRDRPIHGSNIHDLLSDMFAISKTRLSAPRPTGFSSFISVLNELNVPRTLIRNRKYLSELHPKRRSSLGKPKPK